MGGSDVKCDWNMGDGTEYFNTFNVSHLYTRYLFALLFHFRNICKYGFCVFYSFQNKKKWQLIRPMWFICLTSVCSFLFFLWKCNTWLYSVFCTDFQTLFCRLFVGDSVIKCFVIIIKLFMSLAKINST